MTESPKRPSVAPEHRDSLADIYGPDSAELQSLSSVFDADDEELEAAEDADPPSMETTEIVAVLRKSLHPTAPEAEPGPFTRVPILAE